MRKSFAALVLLPLLPLIAACGDDDNGADDAGAAEPELVQVLVLTSAGGEVAPTPYLVEDRAQMKAYVRTFDDRDDVAEAIQQAVTDAGERDGDLAVATVAIGCEVPEDVTISEGADGWEVGPEKAPTSKVECFAPTTSIALVELP